ncbi:MAG: hypothetical protein ABR593_11225, partial [Candidatus Limnocylindria bacterium]
DGQPAYVALDYGEWHLGIGLSAEGVRGNARSISMWVYTDDCDAAVERLRAAGVAVTEEPTPDHRGHASHRHRRWSRTRCRVRQSPRSE